METEFRKLRELKRKSEQYAIEAKQTAQRLSAENFKLKEDLSRERHHNELTRKNMLREMEQQLDKQATAMDRYELTFLIELCTICILVFWWARL